MRVLSFVAFLFACLTSEIAVAQPLVAVIDSGIARTAELAPLLVREYDMASVEPRPAFVPRYDHGTMVATILAREAHRGLRIVSFRIDDPAGCPEGANPPCQPSPAPLARAIRTATSLGVAAINISLALDDDPEIVRAVHEATQRGIVVVMAAGNNGWDHPSNLRMALAGYPGAILVGALDAQGKPWVGTNLPGAGGAEPFAYVWQRGVAVPTSLANGAAATGTGTSFAVPIETARRLRTATGTPAA